jgi:lysine-N-methylase
MKIYAPSYYKDFKCINSKCEHNCCIGWEIDIDENSLDFYKTKKDIWGHIDLTDTPHFVLDDKERCPFLKDNNLCELIINYGENSLCQICRDHPRFKNYYNTRTEIGLGLTCEASAKLILENDFHLTQIGQDSDVYFPDKEEEKFFKEREKILEMPIDKLKRFLPDLTIGFVANFLKELERLDSNWDKYLDTCLTSKEKLKDIKVKDKKLFYRLFSYFVYRHLYNCGLSFCLLCTFFVLIFEDDIYSASRLFSSEIEYSDENIEKLTELLQFND